MNNQKGVTLIELLVAMIIASIAFLGVASLFYAERIFWALGKKQAEAQRDAQMALRSMARTARQTSSYIINGNAVTFNSSCGGTRVFQLAGVSNDQLEMVDANYNDCVNAPQTQTVTLIDGNRSKVTQLIFTSITSKLVDVQIQVTRESQKSETLQTNIFLRNA